jgi:hypothetical protein
MNTQQTPHTSPYAALTLNQTEHFFSGVTFDLERDGNRLAKQYLTVFALMRDGHWRTLDQISQLTGAPTHSASARLRDMRKKRHGSHIVLREYVAKGIFRYRLIENVTAHPHLEEVDRHTTAQDHCVTESAEKFTTTKKWSAT